MRGPWAILGRSYSSPRSTDENKQENLFQKHLEYQQETEPGVLHSAKTVLVFQSVHLEKMGSWW